MTIFKGAPNVALAKELALNLLAPENFNKIASLGSVLFTPAYQNLWTPELLAAEPRAEPPAIEPGKGRVHQVALLVLAPT